MQNDFEPRVLGLFPSIVNKGEAVLSEYRPDEFGNAQVVIKVDSALFRLYRDRGKEFLDVAGDEAERNWFDLKDVLRFLSCSESIGRLKLEYYVQPLSKNLSKIVEAFSSNYQTTARTIERDRSERARQYIQRLLRKE